jgi:hypothetical protein
VLDKTYANCVDQTSSQLFYAIAAVENMLIFGADVSNAFAEAPPLKQGFDIHPDRAFHELWVKHKKRPPIPPNHVIPILSAMQGHPESPHVRPVPVQQGEQTHVCTFSKTAASDDVVMKRLGMWEYLPVVCMSPPPEYCRIVGNLSSKLPRESRGGVLLSPQVWKDVIEMSTRD